MLRARVSRCVSDTDYARFARFYVARSGEFYNQYTLHDALIHLITTTADSHVLLLDDDTDQLVGFAQYRYEEDDTIAFVDSTILAQEHRSGRVFFEGFRDLVRHILQENSNVRTLQFHALADHRYLNRLYGKFAQKTGVRDSPVGTENIYTAGMDPLLQYLRLDNSLHRT